MARQNGKKNPKKSIYLFLEGISEEKYFKEFKDEFEDKIIFKFYTSTKGGSYIFNYANKMLKKNKILLSDIDQVWIIFDTEKDFRNKWEEYKDILKESNINLNKVKLLMTSKCIEYFFLLHYEHKQPEIAIKCKFEDDLKKYKQNYTKTNENIIKEIYLYHNIAINNSKQTVTNILKENNQEYKSLKQANYDFYEVFFKSEKSFSLIFQAFEYAQEL